ncbi:MAG: hypothetical protein U0V73_01665 [Acidimicrobiia bacterium]
MTPGPVLRSISPDASPEEVAAIVAAVGALESSRTAGGAEGTGGAAPAPLREWSHASRLTARRKGLARGPWRVSGRIGRRSRA